jgi:hypothetical protein
MDAARAAFRLVCADKDARQWAKADAAMETASIEWLGVHRDFAAACKKIAAASTRP